VTKVPPPAYAFAAANAAPDVVESGKTNLAMSKYRVLATESIGYELEIEAECRDDALEKASALTWEDFICTDQCDFRIDDVQEVSAD